MDQLANELQENLSTRHDYKDISTDIEISSCWTRIVLLSLLWCFQEHQTYGIRKVIDETTRSGQNYTRAKIGRGSADDIRTILASGRNKTFLQGLSSWTIDNCGKGVFESLQQLLTRMLGITEFLITQCASSTQLKENAETKTKDFGKYIFSCLIIVDPKHIGILL